MKKDDIEKAINFSGEDKDIKQEIIRIADTLTAIPSEADLGAMTSVEELKGKPSYFAFTSRESRLNDLDKNEIISGLQCIRIEIGSWIQNNRLIAQGHYLYTEGGKASHRRKRLLAILGMIAIAAIILSILSWTSVIPENIKIGEIVGLFDLVIGIGGLFYEVGDDSRKYSVCGALQEIESTDGNNSEKLLLSTEKFSTEKRRNIILCLFNFGTIIGTQGN